MVYASGNRRDRDENKEATTQKRRKGYIDFASGKHLENVSRALDMFFRWLFSNFLQRIVFHSAHPFKRMLCHRRIDKVSVASIFLDYRIYCLRIALDCDRTIADNIVSHRYNSDDDYTRL